MKIVKTVSDLNQYLANYRDKGEKIGLVPTMGALHDGHIKLVERCVAENALCITSIFVNPTQFNDKKDLDNYPRTPEADATMLEAAGCKIVFMPNVDEMYPEPDERVFEFGPLEKVMEGAFRPGHFNGVAQIVSKLFNAVKPDRAYFGEKDFQQLAIIRKMTSDLKYPIEIIPCPIVREDDGLAMSSRNTRLTATERKKAPIIAQLLFKSLTFADVESIPDTLKFVTNGLSKDDLFKLEYFEIVDGESLQPIEDWTQSDYIVGCIAVYCGAVRLIDNIVYKRQCS